MRFLASAHTDIGISKKVNQDAFGLKIAKTPRAGIAFGFLCDGMGGLKNGELASALVINAFSSWFENEFPPLMENGVDLNSIQSRWNEIAYELNQKIINYGRSKGFALGTTLTGLLIIEDKYLFIQIGDSRIYRINNTISQITRDHSVVAMEVEKNRLTKEQAKTDSRKNVLLQCVGASESIVPDFEIGIVRENDVFLICSDGFCHEVSEEEMYGILASNLMSGEKIMKKCLIDLVELNKSRNEKDNITAMLLKAIK